MPASPSETGAPGWDGSPIADVNASEELKMKKSSIVLIVTGSLASLFAVGLLAIGTLAFVGESEKDGDGGHGRRHVALRR
jgi:hypothetical protein